MSTHQNSQADQTSATARRRRAVAALAHRDSSLRLRAALEIGTYPDAGVIDALIDRCGIEPDFFVRDMLTWALTRHDADIVVPKLLAELQAAGNQRRSQALHTLSKIGDQRTWQAITSELLRDPDDEVARAAWRSAAGLVPEERRAWLTGELISQLGRGDRDVHLSLSRALIMLGPVVIEPLAQAARHPDERVRVHAAATEKLRRDPDGEFSIAIDDANRIRNLGAHGR